MNHESYREFETTNWTLIERLRGADPAQRELALEKLVRTYYAPVYAYLRQLGRSREHAAELTQAFFADKVLGGDLFTRADRSRAKLRTLMCTALRNFCTDEHRRREARRTSNTISLQQLIAEEQSVSHNAAASPDDAFQQRWASSVLEETLRRCEEYYTTKGKPKQWQAFYLRTIRPILSGGRPPAQATLAQQLELRGPDDVSQAVFQARKRFMVLLHDVVADTVDDPDQVSEEVQFLMGTLGVA